MHVIHGLGALKARVKLKAVGIQVQSATGYTPASNSHAAPMSKTPTQLKDLAVGDLIFTNVMVNIADIADPNSKSSTTRR